MTYQMHLKFRTLPITLPLNARVKPGNIVIFKFPRVLDAQEKQNFLAIMQRLERFNNPPEFIKDEVVET